MYQIYTALLVGNEDSRIEELKEVTTEIKEVTTEKIEMLASLQDKAMEYGLDLFKKIVLTIITIYLGRKLIHFIVKVVDKYFKRSTIEVSVAGFLTTFVKATLYILMITLIVVEILGIQSGSVIAVVGSAGLSIGLALQGGLSNFAGGVLILILKPFRVDDYIVSNTFEGRVISIDIFYTKLLTFDNKLVVMPNGALSNSNIINVTNEPDRRLDLYLPISYNEDVQKVKSILRNIVESSEYVLLDKGVDIFIDEFTQSSVRIGIRVWVLKENFYEFKWKLLEDIKKVFDENKIYLQITQMNVNINQ